MQKDLTEGSITGTMLRFALPMILGNLLQQCYNVADTLIVGRFLGADALAAVGSAYTLMTFLTSILLGMCMGSGAVFSLRFGEKNSARLKISIYVSFVMIAAVALAVNLAVVVFTDPIMSLLCVPEEIYGMMREYLRVIFSGILAVFLYNFYASLLRAVGNSLVPLIFLGISAVLNIILDLVFVLVLHRGVAGAAEATVISQFVSGIGIGIYTLVKMPEFRVEREHMKIERQVLGEISQFSFLTCIQQSAGKQLRNGGDGCLCRSGKDRFLCLYAGSGLWKCIFHLYSSELRSRKKRQDPCRNPFCCDGFRSVLPVYLLCGMHICKAAPSDFCPTP